MPPLRRELSNLRIATGKASAPEDCRDFTAIRLAREDVHAQLTPSMARLWEHYVDRHAFVRVAPVGDRFALVVDGTTFRMSTQPTRPRALETARRFGLRVV